MFSKTLIDSVKSAKSIAIIGNGGNLAIARHAASDMSRHLDKFCFAPEAVHLTALGGDDGWHDKWVDQYGSHAELLIGITTRSVSPIGDALMFRNSFLFAPKKHRLIPTVVIPSATFHEFEVKTLWQFYMLMEKCGAKLPRLGD